MCEPSRDLRTRVVLQNDCLVTAGLTGGTGFTGLSGLTGNTGLSGPYLALTRRLQSALACACAWGLRDVILSLCEQFEVDALQSLMT